MNTITVASILERSTILLQDVGYVRWTKAERLLFINDAQREIASNPAWKGASEKTESLLLAPGKTDQVIPSDGIRLNEVIRNLGSNGTTPGMAIRATEKTDLDRDRPTWHMDENSVGYVKNFAFNKDDPTKFYTYPKAPATALYVEISFVATPAEAVEAGLLQVDDAYANKVLDYLLFRCYAKETEAGSIEKSVAYFQAFLK